MKTQFIFVRHGETDWNVARRLQGRTDRPLNEKGRAQAQQVGLDLVGTEFAAIYSSGLSRAHETATIIAAHHGGGGSVIPDGSFAERSYAYIEGMVIEEYHSQYREQLDAFRELPHDELLLAKVIPEMESYQQVVDRVFSAIHRIAILYPGKTVLVVSHGGVMQSIVVALTRCKYGEVYIRNGQTIAIASDGEQLSLQTPAEELLASLAKR